MSSLKKLLECDAARSAVLAAFQRGERLSLSLAFEKYCVTSDGVRYSKTSLAQYLYGLHRDRVIRVCEYQLVGPRSTVTIYAGGGEKDAPRPTRAAIKPKPKSNTRALEKQEEARQRAEEQREADIQTVAPVPVVMSFAEMLGAANNSPIKPFDVKQRRKSRKL